MLLLFAPMEPVTLGLGLGLLKKSKSDVPVVDVAAGTGADAVECRAGESAEEVGEPKKSS